MSWPLVALCELGDFRAGFGFPIKFQGKSAGEIPFAKVGDISSLVRSGGKYIYSAGNYLTKAEIKEIKAKTIPTGSIVFAKIGEAIRQNFRAITSGEFVIDNNTMAFVPNLEKVDLSYLYYFMCGLDLYRYTAATTVPALRKSVLETIQIPLPPLETQKQIAAVLEKADQLRKDCQQMKQELNSLAQSVFIDMFGDPVSNPKGWEVKSFSDISEVITGNTPSRAKSEYYGSDIEWIKSNNINTPSHLLTESKEKLSEKGKQVGRVASSGSVLMTCIAGSPECIGNVAITNREVAFNQQINALVPHDGMLCTEFLYILCLVGKKIIQSSSTNSMKGMISKSKLENVKLPIPPFDEQVKFSNYFQKIVLHVLTQQNQVLESNALFKALMQQSFKGELNLYK